MTVVTIEINDGTTMTVAGLVFPPDGSLKA